MRTLQVCLTAVAALAGVIAAVPAGAQTAFDGTYSGQGAVTGDYTHLGGFHCTSFPLTLRITGGQFTWKVPQPGAPTRDATVAVAGDGSFKLGMGDYQLSGKVAAGRFVGDSQSKACAFHYDAAKQS